MLAAEVDPLADRRPSAQASAGRRHRQTPGRGPGGNDDAGRAVRASGANGERSVGRGMGKEHSGDRHRASEAAGRFEALSNVRFLRSAGMASDKGGQHLAGERSGGLFGQTPHFGDDQEGDQASEGTTAPAWRERGGERYSNVKSKTAKR